MTHSGIVAISVGHRYARREIGKLWNTRFSSDRLHNNRLCLFFEGYERLVVLKPASLLARSLAIRHISISAWTHLFSPVEIDLLEGFWCRRLLGVFADPCRCFRSRISSSRKVFQGASCHVQSRIIKEVSWGVPQGVIRERASGRERICSTRPAGERAFMDFRSLPFAQSKLSGTAVTADVCFRAQRGKNDRVYRRMTS